MTGTQGWVSATNATCVTIATGECRDTTTNAVRAMATWEKRTSATEQTCAWKIDNCTNLKDGDDTVCEGCAAEYNLTGNVCEAAKKDDTTDDTTDGDKTDGDTTDGDKTDGDTTDDDKPDGDTTDDDKPDGDKTDGEGGEDNAVLTSLIVALISMMIWWLNYILLY